MLFYHYYLQDKDFKSRKGRDRDSDLDSVRHFRGIDNKFAESEIDAMNAEFKNDYQRDKKYVIAITKCMEYSLELCAAVSVDSVDKSDFDEKIAAAFPDMEIITRREMTVKDFKREIAFFKPELREYFHNKGAGHYRLNVADDAVTMEFYPGAAIEPARSFKMK